MKKSIIWIFVLVLLVSSVLAVSKPIAGKINGQTGNVDLFVEVDFLGNKELCTVNPPIITGSDGSFATNLANLVFQEFPEVGCGNQWKIGDQIWYEFDNQQSEVETVASGTGLQRLSELSITTPTQPSSGSGSGSSSSSSQETPIQIDVPEIDISLSKAGENIADLSLDLLNNIQGEIEIKVILSELMNEIPIDTISDKMILEDSLDLRYTFDLENLKPNQYKIQAFIYHQGNLIGVSEMQKFSVKPETVELIELPSPIAETSYLPFEIILIVILALILAYLIFRVAKKQFAKKQKEQ
ncbi:hypothetical protein ACFLZB_04320 [Nanoarchaeota archaeon]